ncbi:unnamed protein product [Blepharisma stoltei]|uniref:TLC domain-containing protein n=1 Tax=Blepharisma stoltei TaxID=1481888 RepID=A0AAU9JIY5_9CILI|nr:unnamed protein product [Blepharisma stoltei]
MGNRVYPCISGSQYKFAYQRTFEFSKSHCFFHPRTLFTCFNHNGNFYRPANGKHKWRLWTYGIAISLGYFIYDTLRIWKFGIYDNFIMLYHGLTFAADLTGVSGTYGTVKIIYGTFFAMVSNLFLHIKKILKYAGQKEAKSYLLAELAFIVAFLIMRLILWPITYGIATSWNAFWLLRIVGFYIEMDSLKWLLDMYFIVKKRYRKYKIRRRAGQSLPWFVKIKKAE